MYGVRGSSTIRSCAFLSGGDRRRRHPGRLLDLQQRTLLWSSTTDRSFASSNAQEIKPRASNNDVYESSMDVVSPSFGISSAEPELKATSAAVPKPLNGNIRAPPAVNEDGTIASLAAEEPKKTVDQYPSVEAFLQAEGIESRPVDGGMWDVREPLAWTENFGRRSKKRQKELDPLIRLKPGDEGYFDVSDIQVPGCAIVRTVAEARIVLEQLNAADPDIFHACDTEVMDIDLKKVGPVGNGYVTCVSIYSGPDFDYGLGHGPGATLWIDNLDDACGVLQEFKAWFENDRFLKVWHNYGFDRHVMYNEGIDVRGFGGDTMHMARLQDSSRDKVMGGSGGGYSLEALTSDLLGRRKQPMKEIFGIKRKRSDGTDGLLVDLPSVEAMQRNPLHRSKWIKYSCYDAEGTWLIRNVLDDKLQQMTWLRGKNLSDYYWMHMRPFGEVLTDLERRGIRVNADDYLAKVEEQAHADRDYHDTVFRKWAAKQIGTDGLAINSRSSVQLNTFLFGGAINSKTKEATDTVKVFKVPRDEIPQDALEAYRMRDEAEAAEKYKNGTQKHPRWSCVWDACACGRRIPISAPSMTHTHTCTVLSLAYRVKNARPSPRWCRNDRGRSDNRNQEKRYRTERGGS